MESGKKAKVVMNWSSGKDSALALAMMLQHPNFEVAALLTTLSADYNRIFMHGVREALLDAQAAAIGIPIMKAALPAWPDNSKYEAKMAEVMAALKAVGVTHSVFGDLFLEELKTYREAQLEKAGLSGLFPLWKIPTHEIIDLLDAQGIEAVTVCVDANVLDASFLGKRVDRAFVASLPPNVDPCGENGEFHTFVYNAPYFSAPVAFEFGETVHRKYEGAHAGAGFHFIDLLPIG